MIIDGNMKLFSAIILILFLSGCAGLINDHEFNPVGDYAISIRPSAHTSDGSIYPLGRDIRLYEDRTARRIGDLLTIRLIERTQASKSASTSVGKESEISLGNPTLFGRPVDFGNGYNLGAGISGGRDFEGAGSSDQSNSLRGELAAVVVDVHPNGNLVVQGEKMLTLNQGNEFVKITGMVRPDDIAPDNSVLSSQVADARITYAGTGALADANAVGWLGRVFLSPLWPF